MRKCALPFLSLLVCLFASQALGEAFPLTEEDAAYRRDTRLWQPEKDDEWVYRRPDTPKMSPRRAVRQEAENPDDDRPRRRRGADAPRIAREVPDIREIPSDPEEKPEERARTPRSSGWNFSDRSQRSVPVSRPEPERPVEAAEEPRAIASLDSESGGFNRAVVENEETQPSKPIPAMVRFGLYAGMSNLSAGDAATQDSRQEQALAQNFALGLGIDGRFLGFLGAELDAYYGIAPTVTLTEPNNPDTITKSIKQSGVMANVKAQFALAEGFGMKIGAGYGSLKINHFATRGASVFEASQSLAGPFGTLGLEWLATENVIISIDYARSLSSAGSVVDTTQLQPVDTAISGSYDRIRFGGLYRISPHFLGGLQLNLRKVSSNFTPPAKGTGPTGSESLSQFLVLGMLEF